MSVAIDELGTLREDGTIVFERHLPGPVERVWNYVIDGDKRALWLAGGDMPAMPGAKATMLFHHQDLADDQPPAKYANFDHAMTMDYEVLACRPPHHVSFTWPDVGTRHPNDPVSIVSIDLSPEGDGVRLRLTHSQAGYNTGNLTGLLSGWDAHLGLLADALAQRKRRLFWASLTGNETLYAERYVAQFAALAARQT